MIIWKTIPFQKVILLQRTCTSPDNEDIPLKNVIISISIGNYIFQPSIFRHEGGQTPCLRCNLQCHHWNGAPLGPLKNGWSETQGEVWVYQKRYDVQWHGDDIFWKILLVVPSAGIKFRNFLEVKCHFLCGRGQMGNHTHMMVFVCCVWKLWRITCQLHLRLGISVQPSCLFISCWSEHVRIDLRTQQPSRVGWLIP